MLPEQVKSRPSLLASRNLARRVPVLLLALCAAAASIGLGGCITSGSRERYYTARSEPVPPQQGNGEVRLALWPVGPEDLGTLATIEREDSALPGSTP